MVLCCDLSRLKRDIVLTVTERDKSRPYVWVNSRRIERFVALYAQTKKWDAPFQRIPFYDDISSLLDLLQFAVAIFSRAAKFFLDADELVVLCHTVGTAHRTCLNLT